MTTRIRVQFEDGRTATFDATGDDPVEVAQEVKQYFPAAVSWKPVRREAAMLSGVTTNASARQAPPHHQIVQEPPAKKKPGFVSGCFKFVGAALGILLVVLVVLAVIAVAVPGSSSSSVSGCQFTDVSAPPSNGQ